MSEKHFAFGQGYRALAVPMGRSTSNYVVEFSIVGPNRFEALVYFHMSELTADHLVRETNWKDPLEFLFSFGCETLSNTVTAHESIEAGDYYLKEHQYQAKYAVSSKLSDLIKQN